jgi:hypothetical protein
MPGVTKVFFSYAREDRDFIEKFGDWLANGLDLPDIGDYMKEGISFGSISKQLKERVASSAVALAFVSKYYIERKYPLLEWSLALADIDARELIFVPIILDSAGQAWWGQQKQKGLLRAMGIDPAYSDFTDGKGGRTDLAGLKETGRITTLAKEILKALDNKPQPGPDPAPDRKIVVLGHPTVAFPDGVKSATDELCKDLKDSAISLSRWDDEWSDETQEIAARELPKVCEDAIFVQPLNGAEAGKHAVDPKRERNALLEAAPSEPQKAKIAKCRIVLWLPKDLDNPRFAEQVKVAAESGNDPMFRSDDPQGLSLFLKQQIRSVPPYIHLKGALNPKPEIAATQDAFLAGIVEAFKQVEPPSPRPGKAIWAEADQIKKQVEGRGAKRILIALHDLNEDGTDDLSNLIRDLDGCDATIEGQLPKGVRILRTLLLFRKVSVLSGYEAFPESDRTDWWLLSYQPGDEPQGPVVRPSGDEAFRRYTERVRAWMSQ